MKKIKGKTAKKLDQRELIGRNWAKFTNLQDNLPLGKKKIPHNPKVIKRRISVICSGGGNVTN